MDQWTTPVIFDGHNDALSRLAEDGLWGAAARFRSDPRAAVDLRRARAGGFGGGLFAVWVPSAPTVPASFMAVALHAGGFSIPQPPAVPYGEALRTALKQIAIVRMLENEGCLTLCRTAREVKSAMAKGRMAAVLHMEGAEAIDRDLFMLDVLHGVGLRSLGPVWSRPNRFGHGVPFRFPASPDTGPGLTADGVRLVERCNELRIALDVSHLTEAGFWDVARHSHAPLVATHSNAHALCANTRNLTDRQLDAIADTGGMVGVNFATAFLREDGRLGLDAPAERILEHIDYLLERVGEDGVGLGSDFDGAVVPEELAGVEDLPRLRRAMAARGYGRKLIDKICRGNWLRVLRTIWGE